MSKKQEETLRKFSDDVERYLRSKLPNIPEATAMEIGEYISNRTGNMMLDWLAEYQRIQNNRMKRMYRGRDYSKYFKDDEEDTDDAS